MSLHCTFVSLPLSNEHFALCRAYAEAQERCSRHMAAQRAELVQLQAEVLRLRAKALVLTTALAWQRDAHANHANHAGPSAQHPAAAQEAPEPVAASALVRSVRVPCPQAPLQSSLAEANLVICQVGCLSHGAYWRGAQDQCRRSGQTCVVVECAGVLQAAAALPAPAAPLVRAQAPLKLQVKTGSSPCWPCAGSYPY